MLDKLVGPAVGEYCYTGGAYWCEADAECLAAQSPRLSHTCSHLFSRSSLAQVLAFLLEKYATMPYLLAESTYTHTNDCRSSAKTTQSSIVLAM